MIIWIKLFLLMQVYICYKSNSFLVWIAVIVIHSSINQQYMIMVKYYLIFKTSNTQNIISASWSWKKPWHLERQNYMWSWRAWWGAAWGEWAGMEHKHTPVSIAPWMFADPEEVPMGSYGVRCGLGWELKWWPRAQSIWLLESWSICIYLQIKSLISFALYTG